MSLIQVQIKKDYYDLVPRPLPEQYEALKLSIMEDGQQLPIIINKDGIILDGHTRFEICEELKIKPFYKTKKFDDDFDERHFVIISNLSRRNLTLFQRAELIFDWWIKKKTQSRKGVQRKAWQTRRGEKSPRGDTHGILMFKVGKILGCTHTVAYKAMKLIEKADETTIKNLHSGQLTISGAYEKVFQPKWKKPKDYGYERYRNSSLKKCLICGKPTKTVNKDECHVHDRVCCTNCGWGF